MKRILSLLVLAVLLASTAHTHDGPHGPVGPVAPAYEEPPPPEPAPAAEGEKKEGEKEEKKEEEKWDVNNPPGPSKTVTIDTSEGTWMSLDVSPDGQSIVFDLLGDLYVVPMAGGEATALTNDVAWQMQPRFSPDGKSIAFTSDQGGGDNVWVMDRDGKNPKQVTKETFRLLNSPVWTPDGEYLVARKHFTSQRSVGAGEMWIYHKSGGSGLQLTAKPNDQKDAGEPAVSPDGRYVYFSQDTTPGAVFQYNKDPNGQIYVIQRLDRETGKLREFINGPGGAIRPTPSPDGKSIAYIRRIRGKSVLHVQDLASGKERPLFDGLDRDMQETWAIHGVYPTMAWTPDGKTIVFWAGGKIHRIDVASAKVAEIPFHVRAEKKVLDALRFPIEVAPAKFATKMLQWVEVSPKGDRVVYQALGHLYIRNLPDGTPRRLTRQNDHWEVYPSFSRDGRQIVYTTWDDDAFGSVRVISADGAGGGEGKVVVSQPGHYIFPAFAPDGKTVVYQKIEGGFVRSPLWSREPGIYRVPAGGGESTLITEEGNAPHFGAASDRVFLFRFAGDKRKLISIGLDGTEERTHLESEWASEFKVSPDGHWVAFAERFNAYVTPFVATGKAVTLSAGGGALPQKRVTKDAGTNLHWSGDSKSLHWSLGPELFTLELKNAFAFFEGAPEKLPDPPASGVNIGFEVDYDAPKGTVAIVGGRIVTMKGDEIVEDGVVLIQGNRIQAVGRRGDVAIPQGAYVVNGNGKTVIPGLIDVHWHGTFGTDGIIPERNWVPYASLAYGVTTLHDPSNDTETVFAASELAKAGLITAPRIYSTGTILYGATTAFTATIDKLDDARSHLRRMKAAGAFSVKSYNQPRREQRQQVVQAARELEMMVVPEGGSIFQHNMTMVVDGHTGVEHSIPVGAIYSDVRQLWSATEVGYTPTLVVGYGGLWGEEYWYDKTRVWEDERLLSFVPREIIDPRSRRRRTAPDEEWNHFNNARIAAELAKAGVEVQLGAHGQREGLAAHWELWMFVQGGMTPQQALRASTLWGAHYLGLDKDLGSIEPGKLADVVVLDANPLESIRNSTAIYRVIQNGRVYDGKTLDQLAPDGKKRGAFYWEEGK